jgi:integrase
MKNRRSQNGCRKVPVLQRIFVATKLAILLQGAGHQREAPKMRQHPRSGMTLYAPKGGRKYLNAAERTRFRDAVRQTPPAVRLFCLMLMWSGGRISEALALTAGAIDLDSGVAILETLKRRQRGHIRQVPLPPSLLRDLDRTFGLRSRQRDPGLISQRIWPWSRTTAWRHMKAVMAAAQVCGPSAMPKGLRHTFGVSAFQANVPPHLVQRWLGHASLRTTAIYGDVSGSEERAFAGRLWRNW